MKKIGGYADLPASIARNIGDKLYDRRKLAALEVEQLVQSLASQNDTERIYSLADTLAHTYAVPTAQSNARKGALLCLSAISVGLAGAGSPEAQSEAFLSRVLPPILVACTDQDSRVRYYSLEALFNIVKSTRPAVLSHFSQVFDILFRLCSDSDANVQNATSFLSDLLKDCVAQSPDFDLEAFLPVLTCMLEVDASPKRLFLLGWISLLDSLAHADRHLHRSLPQLLPSMLNYLEDEAPEVHYAAQKLLQELSKDIVSDPSRTDVGELAAVLAEKALQTSSSSSPLEPQRSSSGVAQAAALRLLDQLVGAAPASQLSPQMPAVLRACLGCIDTVDPAIQSVALELNTKLLVKADELGGAEAAALLDAATEGVAALQEAAKLESLRWTALLLQRHASEALQMKPTVLRTLCEALSSTSDRVVQEAAGVLAALSRSHSQGFSEALTCVLESFRGASGAMLLQRRGIVIIERLCAELGAERVLNTFSGTLITDDDPEFARMMAQALNVLLLTSPDLELQHARRLISSALTDSKGASFFTTLFRCFSASSSAGLALSLLARAYPLTCSMLAALADPPLVQALPSTVVELSQLVSLIEAPAFAHLRLQLVDAHEHPALLRALYSLKDQPLALALKVESCLTLTVME